jgi:hypothetical protein
VHIVNQLGDVYNRFVNLHQILADELDIGRRMRRIADAWLGRPYIADSLIGGPGQPERLVVNLQAFDCVTFVECVLAVARSRSRKGFAEELKKTRYREGRVAWSSRLHYFSDWMKSNQKRGAIKIRTRGPGSRVIETELGVLEGLPARRVRFHVVPKQKIHLARRRISAGSIVAFATTRPRLDFFHAGLLFPFSGDNLLLYHASRKAGKVVAEPLDGYLRRNRMRGIAFASAGAPAR